MVRMALPASSLEAAARNRLIRLPLLREPSQISTKCATRVAPMRARGTWLRSGSWRSKAVARANSPSLLPK